MKVVNTTYKSKNLKLYYQKYMSFSLWPNTTIKMKKGKRKHDERKKGELIGGKLKFEKRTNNITNS